MSNLRRTRPCPSTRPGRCRRCSIRLARRAGGRRPRCGGASCARRAALAPAAPRVARGASSRRARPARGFPRTGGPLLVFTPPAATSGAGDDALDDPPRRAPRFPPAGRAGARRGCCSSRSRATARTCTGRRGRSRATSDARRPLPRGGLPVRHRLARAGRDQRGRDHSATTRTSRPPAPSAGCSSCRRPGATRASTPRATAWPTRTTRPTRSTARRATCRPRARADIRRAVFAYNHADWYVNEVLSIAASIPDDYGA